MEYHSVGVFEDQEGINVAEALARYGDVGGKQFSSLKANEERITHHINRALSPRDDGRIYNFHHVD